MSNSIVLSFLKSKFCLPTKFNFGKTRVLFVILYNDMSASSWLQNFLAHPMLFKKGTQKCSFLTLSKRDHLKSSVWRLFAKYWISQIIFKFSWSEGEEVHMAHWCRLKISYFLWFMIAYYWTPWRSELWEVSLIFYLIIGTGIKQLRENIAESKLSYEIMDDAAQAFLKTKIMDNIQKYFHLICFTAYLRDQSKTAKDGITDEDKKAFALTGGKGNFWLFEQFLATFMTIMMVFVFQFPPLPKTSNWSRASSYGWTSTKTSEPSVKKAKVKTFQGFHISIMC